MTKRMNDEEFSEALDRRRHKADAKIESRMDARDIARERDAAKLGQLCRDGKTIYYSWTMKGKYIESANAMDLV
jgi:hypothetical protein